MQRPRIEGYGLAGRSTDGRVVLVQVTPAGAKGGRVFVNRGGVHGKPVEE
jgi:hypothetical protein